MAKPKTFDALITELLRDVNNTRMLEDSMSFDPDRVGKLPLRYRVIALGFVRGYSPEELSAKLDSLGCARLYARNLWEASLIYAFQNRLTYEEWKKLQEICASFRRSQDLEDRFFRKPTISMPEITEYLKSNSTGNGTELETKHLTRLVERRIMEAQPGEKGFEDFLMQNIEAFSPVREKTRYYFCKYLYYMLSTRIERYAKALESGKRTSDGEEDLLDDLFVFKGISDLKRRKHTPQECRTFLYSAGLSCGEIFDAFNYFWFEYVSLDWMQVLLEYYGNIDQLPEPDRQELVRALRKYDPKSYGQLEDAAVIALLKRKLKENEKELDRIYSLKSGGRGYQRNRAGENVIRKYIKGTLDIDRTTLLCFLLFFGKSADLSREDAITRGRLTDILLECGFPGLREDDEFDNFVIRYLDSEDPVSLLMEEVTKHALEERNFYLYRVYGASTSYFEEMGKLL